MIDWAMVGANGLWIVGLVLGLATLSYASWDAWDTHETFRRRLGLPLPQRALALAGFLFCLGLGATSRLTWQVAVWLVLAGLFLWQVWMEMRGKR